MNSTLFHIALANSPIDVIKLLLSKEVKARCISEGYSTNILATAQMSRGGTFPIHVACMRKDIGIDIIKTLLRLERASISYTDGKGNTPLDCVCYNKDIDEKLVKLLLDVENDYGIRPEEEADYFKSAAKTYNWNGETPLHIAVKARATGAHNLLRPELIYLKGLGSEGRDNHRLPSSH